MCFCASVSFTAAAVLVGMGTYSIYHYHQKETWMLSVLILFLGLQQAIEGIIWLILNNSIYATENMTIILPYMYLFFAAIVWPVWIPIACAVFDRSNQNRSKYIFLILIGWVTALTIIYLMLTSDIINAYILNNHIIYYGKITFIYFFLYHLSFIIAVIAPPLLSPNRYMQLWGVLLFLSLLVSYLAYTKAHLSIWCFFGALTSPILLLALRKHTQSNYDS